MFIIEQNGTEVNIETSGGPRFRIFIDDVNLIVYRPDDMVTIFRKINSMAGKIDFGYIFYKDLVEQWNDEQREDPPKKNMVIKIDKEVQGGLMSTGIFESVHVIETKYTNPTSDMRAEYSVNIVGILLNKDKVSIDLSLQ